MIIDHVITFESIALFAAATVIVAYAKSHARLSDTNLRLAREVRVLREAEQIWRFRRG